MTTSFRERAVVFGREDNLAGVVTYPSTSSSAEDGPGFVILNSGIIHRVGTCRLSVRMARMVAGLGIPVLRFDQSGVGDSKSRTGAETLEEAAERDIDDAMSYVATKLKINRFVFGGLCSGAAHSLQTAWRDPRVVGTLLLDPPAYGTRRSIFNHYSKRLTNIQSWKNALLGRNRYSANILQRTQLLKKGDDESSSWPDRLPYWPEKKKMKIALKALTQRDVKIFIVYTGSEETYNYPDQLRDTFPEECATGNISWSYLPESDHIFTREECRQEVLGLASTWFSESGFVPK